MVDKEKIREIYQALPKLNCGFCGYANCGQYARAVAEGRVSPYHCIGGFYIGYKLSEILGIKAPTFAYGFYSMPFAKVTGTPISVVSLRREVATLHEKVDDIIARLENLKSKQMR